MTKKQKIEALAEHMKITPIVAVRSGTCPVCGEHFERPTGHTGKTCGKKDCMFISRKASFIAGATKRVKKPRKVADFEKARLAKLGESFIPVIEGDPWRMRTLEGFVWTADPVLGF